MRYFKTVFFLLGSIFFLTCGGHKSGTRLVIYTRAPLNSILEIYRPGYFDQKETLIDSAVIMDNHDSLVFFIPDSEQRVYKIKLKNNAHLPITLINDSKQIRIHADYFADTCRITGSDASLSLKLFQNRQQALSMEMAQINSKADSLAKVNKSAALIDSLKKAFYDKLGHFYSRYKSYADTVKSPAAFMLIFNTIDFGRDYKGLKLFIIANAARFPNYKPMQQLKSETLATVKIYEEDLNVGDKIPSITLFDQIQIPFSTSGLQGHYYLVDFWSTWCQQCIAFKNAEYNLYNANKQIPLKFVGVALDDNIQEWRNMVKQFKHPSTELIDTKMWQGPTVQALLFDSIPYNFLVNPQGKIIAKAIKPDSLAFVIKKLVR